MVKPQCVIILCLEEREHLLSCTQFSRWIIEVCGAGFATEKALISVRVLRVCHRHQGIYGRNTPPVHSTHGNQLLGVICNVGAKAIDCPAKVVIRASDNIPCQHVTFDRGVDNSQTPMEQTAAEITEDLIFHVIPGTCKGLGSWVMGVIMRKLKPPFGIERKPIKTRASLCAR